MRVNDFVAFMKRHHIIVDSMSTEGTNAHYITGRNHCPTTKIAAANMKTDAATCASMNGTMSADGTSCDVDICEAASCEGITSRETSVDLVGDCPEAVAGTVTNGVCRIENACLAKVPVAVNLAGPNRCKMLGMSGGTIPVKITATAAECARYGGVFADGKCSLVSCSGAAGKACGADDTLRRTLSINSVEACGSLTSSAPGMCDLQNVCVRASPGNPKRLHLIRPDLVGCDGAATASEGEVLLGGVTSEECARFGGEDNFVASQCRLDSQYIVSDGKCLTTVGDDAITGKGSVEHTDGTIIGLGKTTCEQVGGTYEDGSKTCTGATYCALEGVNKDVCVSDVFQGWARDWGVGGVGATFGIIALIIIVIVFFLIMTARGEKIKDLREAFKEQGRVTQDLSSKIQSIKTIL